MIQQIEKFEAQFDRDRISQGHPKVIHNDIIFYNFQPQVCITEICQIESFQGQFDLHLISQDHPKYGM